ncbi:hypothetical protein ACH5RR_002164 [Cinchona calisaya]|uniref:Btz domain-containing protein n=1 Tax=Cinchona calisaya TaxID=153742 RepID=A0ABD3B650_9GENT
MSRRDSESKRHRSRFDQEPSPKRSRRDGKPETERLPANSHFDNRDPSDHDHKHRRRLQDALPLEAPSEQDSKVEGTALSKESNKANADREGTKYSSNPIDVPRSRSYFQHDERGNAGQVGRSFGRRATSDRGWWRDAKEQQSERANGISTSDMQKKGEGARVHGEGSNAWRHDRYFEMEADPKPPARKRSFREKKDQNDSVKADKPVEELVKPNPDEHPVTENVRRDERRGHTSRRPDQPERTFAGDREANKSDTWRGNFSSRDGYPNRGGNYRGRDRFTARQGYRATGGRVDKWKHDLYDEANRSPSPKNEEDVVAKVEALLAS